MKEKESVNLEALALPAEVARWTQGAPLYESSGCSGAKTLFVDKDGGAYLKIAEPGALARAARMQAYFAGHHMAPAVLCYLAGDKDYMITEALAGEDGTADAHIGHPARLAEAFGQALRRLHAIDARDCPVRDALYGMADQAAGARFLQAHLDDIAGYIGPADAEKAAEEIAATRRLLQSDVLLHGDYCLPNIMLKDWAFQGFIDVGEGGLGDRHYDLAWGLWTLNFNLKTPQWGQRFLDAYGRDVIDRDRLRLCGLLAAME